MRRFESYTYSVFMLLTVSIDVSISVLFQPKSFPVTQFFAKTEHTMFEIY